MYQHLQLLLLVVGFTLLCRQLLVRRKQLIHLLFAAFCGSICLMAIKRLGGSDLGFYQYLIGMGVCMTCNGYWLLSRVLFRREHAIRWQHVLVAATVAGLIIADQGLQLAQQLWPTIATTLQPCEVLIGELSNLLSSTILMLTAWEACRGYQSAQGAERWHRQLFLLTFGGAVTMCAIVAKVWFAAPEHKLLQAELVSIATLAILLVTQLLITQRFAVRQQATPMSPLNSPAASVNASLCASQLTADFDTSVNAPSTRQAFTALAANPADISLAAQLQQLMHRERLYLQANVRLLEIAQLLQVPEYRISRVIRYQYQASNFNHYINTLRVEHAVSLLQDPAKQQWPVLVVGLESGFASVGPFTRAFKAKMGLTPHEFRQRHATTGSAAVQLQSV